MTCRLSVEGISRDLVSTEYQSEIRGLVGKCCLCAADISFDLVSTEYKSEIRGLVPDTDQTR